MLGYLIQDAHTTCVSGSVHSSLSMETLSWWVTIHAQDSWHWQYLYEDVWWTGMNPIERASRSRFKEESSLIGRFRSSRVQVFRCRWSYQRYQGLHDDSQKRTRQTCTRWLEALLLVTLQQQRRRRILQDFNTCVLNTWASEIFKLYTKRGLY